MADLIPQIQTNASAPASFEGDRTKSVQQPLSQQIAADRYAKSVLPGSGLPFRSVQVRPGSNADINRDCV